MTLATATDTGNGYGARGCAAEGCGAILAYPDEGAACEAHTCAACGAIVATLDAWPLPWRDEGGAYLDDTATACRPCYTGAEGRGEMALLLAEYKRRG